jgi:hypothetical protein
MIFFLYIHTKDANSKMPIGGETTAILIFLVTMSILIRLMNGEIVTQEQDTRFRLILSLNIIL